MGGEKKGGIQMKQDPLLSAVFVASADCNSAKAVSQPSAAASSDVDGGWGEGRLLE